MVKTEQAPTVVFSTVNEPDLEKKGKALQSFTDIRRASAWPVHRWPIEKNVTWDRVKLHLPRSYLAKDGEDIRLVKPASDINQIVHQHYLEQIDPAIDNWVNFVTADDIVARRCAPHPAIISRKLNTILATSCSAQIRGWQGTIVILMGIFTLDGGTIF
ncbi:hypothetical protein BD779DRAFT_1534045 [Infundibulicybe gibba]|nr:hypothetical protein BD779DRAFT_1534045 [Infundibulicybe gibba]